MIKALIYLTAVSKTVAQVRIPLGRFFRRCPEHDNLLCLEGRALDMDEFNALAPKMINQMIVTQIGSLPCVKLVEVPDVPVPVAAEESTDVTPPEGGKQKAEMGEQKTDSTESTLESAAPPVPVVLPDEVMAEEVDGGFVLADYRAPTAAFLGSGEAGWQGDVSLVTPFPSPEAAVAAFAPAEPAPAPAEPAPKPAKKSKK